MLGMVLFFVLKENKISEPLSTTKIVETCNPYLNIETLAKTGDVKACDCLVDTVKRGQCQMSISDAAYYYKASNQADISLCGNISLAGMKNACVNVVQNKIDFIKKNFGQTLSTTSSKQK